MAEELELLLQLLDVDPPVALLVHPLERALERLELLRLLELAPLALAPLLLLLGLELGLFLGGHRACLDVSCA